MSRVKFFTTHDDDDENGQWIYDTVFGRFFFTVIEFLKLEKVEIGGLRGRQLSTRITAVYVEFNQYFTAFASKSYDVLDPDDLEFDVDFENFQMRILELDMKLAAILCQAFDDCYNLESIFKVSDDHDDHDHGYCEEHFGFLRNIISKIFIWIGIKSGRWSELYGIY